MIYFKMVNMNVRFIITHFALVLHIAILPSL